MEWKPEYSIGIQEVDDQHKMLIAGFSSVEQMVATGQVWSNTHYAIIELSQLARRHFDFEEALMRLFGVPGLAEHQRAHQHFFRRLNEIEARSLHDSAEKEMIQFLFEWLRDHILVTDRDYARFILAGAQVVKSGAS